MYNTNNIINYKYRIGNFIIAILMACCFACADDEGKDVPVFQQEVKFSLNGDIATKSTQYNTFEVGDAIGVFAFVRNDNGQKATLEGNYANNKKWVWSGTEFTPAAESDRIFFSGSKKMDFYTYYPYSVSNSDPLSVSFNSSLDQSTVSGYGNSDLLTAVNNTGIFNQAVPLNFKHRLSTIRIVVEDLGNIQSVALNEVKRFATLNFSDNTLLSSGSVEKILMYNKGSKDGYFTFDASVPVQSLSSGKQLFTVKRNSAPDININMTDGVLKEGEITTFNIALIKNITVNQSTGGIATEGGKYAHGHSLTITASPTIGYAFEGWYEEGIKVSPDAAYTFTVTKDRVLDPIYSKTVYTINATVNNNLAGSVSGGGSFNYGETCTLNQVTNTGYAFEGWYESGTKVSSTASYAFTVESSRNIEAWFTTNSYSLTVIGGTGSGTYSYGTDVQIVATIPVGKTFSKWSDGNTNGTRTVKVIGNATYTAEFTTNQYTLSVIGGTGSGTYNYGTDVQIAATVPLGKTFSKWSDGNTNLTRTVNVIANATYTAEFTTNQYTLSVIGGTGSGTYNYGTNVQIVATVPVGKTFSNWSDGNTNATRTVMVIANATYTAEFTTNSYTLTVNSNNDSYGSAFGGGTYSYGTNVNMQAIPKAAGGDITYSFANWSDGNTNATRSVTVTANATYTAQFQKEEWVYTLTVSPLFMSFLSNGGTKSFSITSTRTKYINDVISSTVENVAYSTQVTGPGAAGFSVSDTSVIASENKVTSARIANIIISQMGGKSITISLEQKKAYDVGTDI